MSTPNIAAGPTLAFTAPLIYAARLHHLLTLHNFTPLSSPTLTVHHTSSTVAALKPHLSPPSLNLFSTVAFPFRTANVAFSAAASDVASPILSRTVEAVVFTIATLGTDAELIDNAFLHKFSWDRRHVRVLVPPIATPSALVHALGGDRRVLCLVSEVIRLTEPPMVPDFLRELRECGWAPVRVNAYETKWAGPECAAELVESIKEGALDAVVFTSTAEVEGLLKSLKELGLGWESVKNRCPKLVVAAHGPVTAV